MNGDPIQGTWENGDVVVDLGDIDVSNEVMVTYQLKVTECVADISHGTAASIAQAFAEAMMVGAFTQLVRKGAPFVLGNFLSSMSLKSGAPTFGMPEPVISNFVIGQLALLVLVGGLSGANLAAQLGVFSISSEEASP